MARKYKVHPYCDFFPRMQGKELEEFQKSLKLTDGNEIPSVVWGGQILDGRHRSDGTTDQETKHFVQEWHPKSKDPIDQAFEVLDLVESRNLHRRHLSAGQRAHAVELIEKERQRLHQLQGVGGESNCEEKKGDAEKDTLNPEEIGGATSSTPPRGKSESAKSKSKKSKASRRTQSAAKKVVDKGTKALNDAVSAGTISPLDAEKVVDQPPEVQDAAVEAVKSGKSKTVAAAVVTNPFDEPLVLCNVVLEHFVPKMQEHALIIQRALGSGAGQFTAGKIANLAGKVFDEFKSVRPVLENAKQKFQCNSAK